MTDLEKIYTEKEIYGDGENFIFDTKADAIFWLSCGAIQTYEEDKNYDGLVSRLEDNIAIAKQLEEYADNAYVGLSYHPMSDWFYVNPRLVDEWLEGEI